MDRPVKRNPAGATNTRRVLSKDTRTLQISTTMNIYAHATRESKKASGKAPYMGNTLPIISTDGRGINHQLLKMITEEEMKEVEDMENLYTKPLEDDKNAPK